MKITMSLLMLLVLLLTSCGKQPAVQDYTQMNLSDGAVARLGKGRVTEVLYSPDGSRLAVQSTIGIWLYDTTTYRVERDRNGEVALLAAHIGRFKSVAFSPDWQTLAVVSSERDGMVQLWDVKTGELKHTLTGPSRNIYDVMFSPDGKTLAGAIGDGTVRLWDAETWEPKQTLARHYGTAHIVVFSPDGRTLASGSADRTVRLWDTETGEQKHWLPGHGEGVAVLSFSPDGRALASGSWDGTVRMWDTETGEQQGALTGAYGWDQ